MFLFESINPFEVFSAPPPPIELIPVPLSQSSNSTLITYIIMGGQSRTHVRVPSPDIVYRPFLPCTPIKSIRFGVNRSVSWFYTFHSQTSHTHRIGKHQRKRRKTENFFCFRKSCVFGPTCFSAFSPLHPHRSRWNQYRWSPRPILHQWHV